MTRRFREAVEVTTEQGPERGHPAPRSFCWRGRTYHVVAVLGHWREDAGYWAGRGVDVPQRDLWRVEGRGQRGGGIFELVRETGVWRLDRVWD